jgi:hypothetical protein
VSQSRAAIVGKLHARACLPHTYLQPVLCPASMGRTGRPEQKISLLTHLLVVAQTRNSTETASRSWKADWGENAIQAIQCNEPVVIGPLRLLPSYMPNPPSLIRDKAQWCPMCLGIQSSPLFFDKVFCKTHGFKDMVKHEHFLWEIKILNRILSE